jgi:hypothetical protein
VPGWSALNFQLTDQHWFGYAIESEGTASDALFTARAQADLDCDGTFSTWEQYLYGVADGAGVDCSVESAPALYVHLETE